MSHTENTHFCSLENLKKLDIRHFVDFSNQKDVNNKMIAMLMDWLMDIRFTFKSSVRTYLLASKLLTLFLSKKTNVTRADLRCYGAACFFLSSKQEDRNPVDPEDLVKVSNNAFSHEHLLELELDVLRTLQYRVNYPTAMEYIQHYERRRNPSAVAIYLTMISSIDTNLLRYSCEEKALAAIQLAKSIGRLFQPNTRTVNSCSEAIKGLCKRLSKSSFHAHKKFMKEYVSEIRDLEDLIERFTFTGLENNPPFRSNIILGSNEIPYVGNTQEKLGEGSFGEVESCYIGRTKCAVKKFEKCKRDGISVSFLREIGAYSAFCVLKMNGEHSPFFHGCVATLEEECVYLESATKGDLKSFIATHPTYFQNHKMLSQATKQLTQGLSFFHSIGMMHRDIKPHNILVFEYGREVRLKYCDFGLVRGAGVPIENNNCFSDEVVTLWYRPLELFFYGKGRSRMTYGPSVDVWSLGCVLYEMCTGNMLFGEVFEGFWKQAQSIINGCGLTKEYLETNYGVPDFEFEKVTFAPSKKIVPDSPIKKVIEGFLTVNPQERMTAKEACDVLMNATQKHSVKKHSAVGTSKEEIRKIFQACLEKNIS